MAIKKNRPSPSESASLYKVSTKRKGNDGNIWIIKENKNGIKRWALFKKVQVGKKNNISTSKPEFYDLDVQIMARAKVLNGSNGKISEPEKIFKGSELSTVIKNIHNFRIIDRVIESVFKPVLTSPPIIKWNKTTVLVDMSVRIGSDLPFYNELLHAIDGFYNIFTSDADRTLEQKKTTGAIVYESGKDRYEYILDNFEIVITHGGKLLRHITHPTYWK